MTLVIRWLLPFILAGVFAALAKVFGNACPGSQTSFWCQNWEVIAAAVAFVCGLLGHPFVPWSKDAVAKVKQAMSTTSAIPPAEPPTKYVPREQLPVDEQEEIKRNLERGG